VLQKARLSVKTVKHFVFDDTDLAQGDHINAIGSYRPEVSEIPPATVCRERIVADHRASALEEAGDLLGALPRGLIQESQLPISYAIRTRDGSVGVLQIEDVRMSETPPVFRVRYSLFEKS
jgi:hypothetical protein